MKKIIVIQFTDFVPQLLRFIVACGTMYKFSYKFVYYYYLRTVIF